MEDQCSKHDAQLDILSQSLYAHQPQLRAIGGSMLAQVPIYDIPIADVACCSSLDDDEMTRWLQYPTEDLMVKSYRSDMFGELPLAAGGITPETTVDKVGQAEQFMTHGLATTNAVVEAEAAMQLGFGRAIGLVKQPGLETFTKVRTTVQPPMVSTTRSYPLDLLPSASLPPIDTSQTNFPLFPLPTATEKAKYNTGFSSLNIQRRHKYCTTEGVDRTDVSTAESTAILEDQSKLCKEPSDVHSYRFGFTQNQANLGSSSSQKHCSKPTNPPVQKGCAECNSEQQRLDIFQNSATIDSAPSDITSKCRLSPPLEDSVRFTDVTLTTSSGSHHKACWKVKSSNLKQNLKEGSREMDVSTDGQSEGATDSKKRARSRSNGRHSTKRNRAAEVHNLSERRRRDRINKKLKALQELIPNSDKSDKASILDEAIEYVKAMQIEIQLQMMFLRSGVAVPATISSTKTEPLPIARMGTGLGMGVGVCKDYLNFASTAYPAITGHPESSLHSLTGASSNANSASFQGNNLFQSSWVMDKYKGYGEHQPLLSPAQPSNMNLWNPYMIHQPHHSQSLQGNQQNQ